MRWRYCRFVLRRDLLDRCYDDRPVEMARWFRTPLDYPPQGTRVRFAEWPDLGWELVDIGAEPSARDSPAECAGEARGWGVREAPQGEGGARVALVEKVALAEQVGERPPARRRLDTETPAA